MPNLGRFTRLFYDRKFLLLYFLVVTCLHGALIWNALPLIKKGYPDFTHMYAAGQIVRRGWTRQLYDDALQYRVQQEFASGVTIRHGALPYNHPPYEAFLFVPLTYLPYGAAFAAWDLVSLLIFSSLPFLLRRYIPLLQTSSSPAYWIPAILAFYPASIALLQGQDIVVLLLLISLSYVCLKTNREFSGGAFLALGLFRFHLLVPFVVMLIVQQRRRVIYGFTAVGTALAALSVIMLGGFSGAMSYPEYAWHAESKMRLGGIAPADMPDIKGFIDTQFSSLLTKQQIDFVYLGVAIVLLAIASRKWRTSFRDHLDLSFSLAGILSVLASYHAFAYDMTLYLIPLTLLLNYFHEKHRVARFTLSIPLGIFYCSPILMMMYGQLNLLAPVMLIWFWGALSIDPTASYGPVARSVPASS